MENIIITKPADKGIDVLFIYTNMNAFHFDTYSFGLGSLSGVLKEKGFTTALEVVTSKNDYSRVISQIKKLKPLIVGFSAVSSQFVFISELAKMIRKIYDGIIVCGGVHTTIFPDCLTYVPQFDGFFVGESEFSFLEFLRAVKKGENHKNVDNFCYIEHNKLIINKLKPLIQDLSILPFADREIYDYQSIIDGNQGIATILASRGCPYHCTYCSNHAIARTYGVPANSIRYNSVDKTLDEIDMLRSNYRFEKLWFIDDLFILNKVWLDELLTKYKKRINLPFMCHIRPNICTREIMGKLKEAGCWRVFLAVESANDYIRNVVMKRGITKEQLENTFKYAKEFGIESLSVNIIGVPGDTEETIMETINFNKKMQPTITGVNIFSPYEGTKLGDLCREKGFIRKVNKNSFFDRRQSILDLPTITNRKLMYLFERFQYLVYKDSAPEMARKYLMDLKLNPYRRIYNRLENIRFFGAFFRSVKKNKLLRRLSKILFFRRAF